MKPDGRNRKASKFDRNEGDQRETREKKPFDKKAYRLKKYSNKYKVEQWEERRKKAVLRGFYKDLERDNKNAPVKPFKISEEGDNDKNEGDDNKKGKKRPNAFHAAKLEFQRKQEEKQRKKEEFLKAKAEREEALEKYKQKRTENYKKLSKKTKKGQPVMKDRLEMLLEKIQKTT